MGKIQLCKEAVLGLLGRSLGPREHRKTLSRTQPYGRRSDNSTGSCVVLTANNSYVKGLGDRAARFQIGEETSINAMKINPNLPPDESFRLNTDQNINQSEKTFPASDRAQILKAGEPALSAAFRAQFTQADLKSPGKMDAVVDWAVKQIVERDFGAIRPRDREAITSWMRKDPVLREAILNYLEKVV